MKILSYNPGHDGAFTYLEDGRLVFSIEAEKGSRYRHSSLTVPDALDVLAEVQTLPDVLCRGGWWPGDSPRGREAVADYRGSHDEQVLVGKTRMLGKTIDFFSSSHERSHLLCAFGMSDLPKGAPCYALLWEGVIGAFYEIDAGLHVTKVGDVMPEPGHRYAMLYALADPTFDKVTAEFSRLSDAGKLMALASYSRRSQPSEEEETVSPGSPRFMRVCSSSKRVTHLKTHQQVARSLASTVLSQWTELSVQHQHLCARSRAAIWASSCCPSSPMS